MMTQHQTKDDTFETCLCQIWDQRESEQDRIKSLRQMAWEKFSEMGLPKGREETFRYVSLKKLYAKRCQEITQSHLSKEAIAPYILPECLQSVMVFINGSYSPELSTLSALPLNIVGSSLNDAFATYGTFIQNHWIKNIKEEKDPFALLNLALHSNAAFLYIPPKSTLKQPLQILSIINSEDQAALILPRWQLFLGNNSQAEIVTRQVTLSGQGNISISSFDIVIEENSHLKLTQVTSEDREDSWCLESGRALLKKDSTLNTVELMKGGEATRRDWRVQLAGENSEANLNGLGLFAGKNEGHVHILMEHQAPHCRSMQFYKNVLRDSSRSSFEGKIYVHQPAQKTDAFQLNNNLLLSDAAQAFTKPNLEIFTDDVKASHGATMGQLDEEQMFYLRARGLDQKLAQNLLIRGFCSEIIDKITLKSINQEIGRAAAQYISEEIR